ncbi:MAG: 2OG-Fe(II) oxygenase family protein [Proteobacteria bacterium]|nr:2OG-Fe(II) oxygenase family protein [Pseudomonadota bacterium]
MIETTDIRFETSQVLRLFPTFVWTAELATENHQKINDNIMRKLDALRRFLPDLKRRESWQSDHALHNSEEFSGLVSCINAAAAKVMDFLKIGHECFEITGCWANIGATGAAHGMHSHPNNFLSGVYYVRTHAGANTINFHDPRSQTGIIRPSVTELTAENADQVVVKVKNGTLLVFPAWLPHSVDANSADRARISISFNIMFSSYAENMGKPLW